MSDTIQELYILYHNLWSSGDLMIRFFLAASKTANQGPPIQFIERQIDVQHKDEIDQYYMSKENPNGQVSATLSKTSSNSTVSK